MCKLDNIYDQNQRPHTHARRGYGEMGYGMIETSTMPWHQKNQNPNGEITNTVFVLLSLARALRLSMHMICWSRYHIRHDMTGQEPRRPRLHLQFKFGVYRIFWLQILLMWPFYYLFYASFPKGKEGRGEDTGAVFLLIVFDS